MHEPTPAVQICTRPRGLGRSWCTHGAPVRSHGVANGSPPATLHPVTAPDRALAATAATQHGAFTIAQAQVAGFSRRQVEGRVASGQWTRLCRGVLAIAGLEASWQRTWIAPLLVRPDAHLSGLAAAHVYGLVQAPLAKPTITVPPGTSARASGAGAVRRLLLPPEDRSIIDGLRCTGPERTLLDLTTVLPPARLRVAVDQAVHRKLVSPRSIERTLVRSRHVAAAGIDLVRGAAAIWDGVRPGSPGEARLLRMLAEHGVVAPQRQVPILARDGSVIGRADVGWTSIRFGLEYDGDSWHGPTRWGADERRHRAIEAAGWELRRVGAPDLLPSARFVPRLVRALAERARQLGVAW